MVTWDRQAEPFSPTVICSAGDTSAGSGWRKHLDGVAAPFLVLALAQQAVRFDVVARHWHGLNYMKAVAGGENKKTTKTYCWCIAGWEPCVKSGCFFYGWFKSFPSNSKNILSFFRADFISRSMCTTCACVLETNIRWDQDPHDESLQG